MQPYDDVDRALVDLGDDVRLAAEVAERRYLRDLHERAEDLATFVGTLLDLAEADAHVAVVGRSGRAITGRLTSVTADHVVLSTPASDTTIVPSRAIVAVRIAGGAVTSHAGDRDPTDPTTFGERLASWMDDPPQVLVTFVGTAGPVRGRLVAVGEDLITIGEAAGTTHLVQIGAIESAARLLAT